MVRSQGRLWGEGDWMLHIWQQVASFSRQPPKAVSFRWVRAEAEQAVEEVSETQGQQGSGLPALGMLLC